MTMLRFALVLRAAFFRSFLLAFASACATGSTFRSGVGDAFPEHAPYYAGKGRLVADARIAHAPVTFQRGASQSEIFDPKASADSPTAALVADINHYLDSLGATTALPADTPLRGVAPDVMFGCAQDARLECPDRDADSTLGRRFTTMRLAVGRPSEEWVTNARTAATRVNADGILVLTLEVGQYWVQQKGWKGDKAVELGTNYTASLPWLSSLEKPVSVVQITGALLDRDGKAVRIGAEGLYVRPTSIVMSSLGAQALITDADVEKIRGLRRTDVLGEPLAWQVAVKELVGRLTGRM